MARIHILPPEIIAKIAAGEVIERPVYAVKELVENALDAHATRIVIHIEESGLKKITVIDNGEGMSKEDLGECFKLHTTSKTNSLDRITTLGFRGEALASIAAISDMTIQSRTKDNSHGTKIILKEGKLQKITPIGMAVGTQVTVSHLFYPVPARQKFLKSPQTEFRHILTFLTTLSLAYPDVHFIVTHNQKTVVDLPSTQDLTERLTFILGNKITTHLIPFSYDEEHVKLFGFVGKPSLATKTPLKQFIFINNRYVMDKNLMISVRQAYGRMLEGTSQPIFILFLTLPYEFVDVNVHPRKEIVRFTDTQLLSDMLYKSVTHVLNTTNTLYDDPTPFGFALGDQAITDSFAGRLLKEQQTPWDIRKRAEIIPFADNIQLHRLYLITQTQAGMLLVDQHAAHERILYAQFSEAFKKEQHTSPQYHFSKPHVLEVSLPEKALLEEYAHLFKNLGIEIEYFKGNTFFITAVPLIFQDRDPEALVTDILSDLEEGKKPKTVDAMSEKMLAYLACRAAIKAGESLTKKQAKDLLEKLEHTHHNATCPHGRPTKISVEINQLHRMFRR